MSSSGRLLLIDDEQGFLDMLTLPLQADGYEVLAAGSGADGLALYAVHPPDLVLLDVNMPGLSGFEVCRRLQAEYGEACAPVIFYTAFGNPNEITEGFDAGGADYLTKPCSLNEIRARIRIHVENHVLAKQQKLLAEQLRRANIAKNRFLGMAAHDLRNPLVSIRGFTEFLLDGTLGAMPTRQLALVSIINGTSTLMLKTVNELLDAATLEANELELKRERIDFADLVARSVARARLPALQRRTRLHFVPPAELALLKADTDKIKQVVDHMLTQAVRQSPHGTLVTVELVAESESDRCTLTIRVQGEPPGGDAGESMRDRPTETGAGRNADEGAALGLAICRNIVRAHQGTIGAETAGESGVIFRLTLPRSA